MRHDLIMALDLRPSICKPVAMTTDAGPWAVAPITGVFGAELTGGSVGSDGFDAAWLVTALEDHRLLVLRDQHLSHAQQVALAAALGEPTPAHPVIPGHPDFPEILVQDGAMGGRNARWHTDVTFMPAPPAASVLVGDTMPAFGGDTMFADTRTAYERLSTPFQAMLDQLEAVHRISPLAYWGDPFDSALSREDAQKLFDDAALVPPVIHPVVRIHPTTGRKNLFVNPGFTTHVVGMSRVESDGLLNMLYEHMTQPEFVLRHRWRSGDVVIWDNRATMHYAVDDYGTSHRLMRRVTIRGDRAVGPTGLESRVADDPLVAVR
jgi:alpha-ketoglutarate-dependent taurine dioxygenase